MGAIGGLLGLSGGAAGTGFSGPQATNVSPTTNSDQINQAYSGTQNSMQSQNDLLAALQGQNGIANQSQVYGQLQGVASGAVNPAQAQFNQNTAANVSNQAALQAGQRGASSNVGLIARQAAQQGAATQQQAVGQEATQQATNQINAIGQAGALATTQAGQQIGQTNANTSAQQAEQANLINAQAGVNNANVSMQSNINSVNAGLAQTTMGNQQNAIGGFLQGGSLASGLMGGSSGGAEGGDVKHFDDGGEVEVAPIATTNPPATPPPAAKSSGGGGSSIASLLPLLALAAADGGDVDPTTQAPATASMAAPGSPAAAATPANGTQSKFGSFLKSLFTNPKNNGAAGQQQNQNSQQPQYSVGSGFASIGQAIGNIGKSSNNGTPSGPQSGFGMPSGSQNALSPADEQMAGWAKGGDVRNFKKGGKVTAASKAEKAAKNGNNYANDKIPAVLSEHEIVLPRSVTLSADPVRASADFVQKVIAKRKLRK